MVDMHVFVNGVHVLHSRPQIEWSVPLASAALAWETGKHMIGLPRFYNKGSLKSGQSNKPF